MIYDCVIVGLGAMGSAALYQLASRGASVIGIDRHEPPHPWGSTHGESRITRQGIGEGADYVPLALRSHEIWRELEAETGDVLLHEVGGLVLAGDEGRGQMHESPFFAQSVAAAKKFGIAHEVLSGSALRERFPQFVTAPGTVAYYEPGGGYVRPERCVAANLRRADALGAEVRIGDVTRVEEIAGRVAVTTAVGQIVAREAVIAAGAWAGPLLGPPFDIILSPTRQVMHWFEAEPEAVATWQNSPVYIWMHDATNAGHFYGFPAIDGSTAIKVADETLGPPIDPAAVDRDVPEADSRRMYDAHVAGRMAGITPRRAKAVTCLYTQAPRSRFVIGRHPGRDHILVVAACSGHGFKHSAAIGEAVAKRVLGEPEELLTPFAPGAA
jgi:sarcosine oxidase